jgi:hypothetical protein
MIKFSTLPLKEGSWFTPESLHFDSLPIIIGGALRYQGLEVGDSLAFDLFLLGERNRLECIIIGVLDENDMYMNLSFGASDPTINSIAIMNRWAYNDVNTFTEEIIILPLDLVLPNYRNTPLLYSPASLLFTELDGNDINDTISGFEKNKPQGAYTALSEMADNHIAQTIYINNESIVTSFALLFFSILGLGGYTTLSFIKNKKKMQIYMICGMSKLYGIVIQIVSFLLLVLLPSIIALLLLPNMLESYSVLNTNVYIVIGLIMMATLAGPTISTIIGNLRISPYLVKE